MGGGIEPEVIKIHKECFQNHSECLKFLAGFFLKFSIPVIYEMIPRAIVTVFFSHDDGQHLASSSLYVEVYNNVETKVLFRQEDSIKLIHS